MKQKKVVVIGGGTGTFVVLTALQKISNIYPTAILTMVDDGGSNKTIRDQFGLLPTSGIRQCMVALSQNPSALRELFTYRFSKGGEGLKGMTFGNIFMAAMADIMGSQQKGIQETMKLLQVQGDILPTSWDDVRLVATYENGIEVTGEHYIDEPEHDGTLCITHLRTEPQAHISEEAKKAILQADHVVMGPGDFYTNTIANLVVEGVVEALSQTKARVSFVTNLMTKYGETYNYTLKDFIRDLKKYVPAEVIDYIIINNNTEYPQQAIDLYKKEDAIPVKDDLEQSDVANNTRIIRADILSDIIVQPTKGDVLARSMIRHDPEKLAKELEKVM